MICDLLPVLNPSGLKHVGWSLIPQILKNSWEIQGGFLSDTLAIAKESVVIEAKTGKEMARSCASF